MDSIFKIGQRIMIKSQKEQRDLPQGDHDFLEGLYEEIVTVVDTKKGFLSGNFLILYVDKKGNYAPCWFTETRFKAVGMVAEEEVE